MQDGTPRTRIAPRWLLLAGLALGGLALGAAALAAPGGLFGPHASGHGFFRHDDAGWDPEQVEGAVRHVLDEVDASDEQVAEVTAIVQRVAEDLRGLHESRDAVREAWTEALVAGDRERLESQRLEMLDSVDTVSQRLVAALGDVAAVLSQEQREALAAAHERHGAGHAGGRHGWRHGPH